MKDIGQSYQRKVSSCTANPTEKWDMDPSPTLMSRLYLLKMLGILSFACDTVLGKRHLRQDTGEKKAMSLVEYRTQF